MEAVNHYLELALFFLFPAFVVVLILMMVL